VQNRGVRVALLAGAIICLSCVTAACGRQVAVTPVEPLNPRCAEVVASLPNTIDGAGLRPTRPESASTAAWGEPPIVFRCGVARPDALEPTSALVEVNGIAWFPETLTAGTAFTAVEWPSADDPVYLEIAVPQDYPAPANVLADVSPILAAIGS